MERTTAKFDTSLYCFSNFKEKKVNIDKIKETEIDGEDSDEGNANEANDMSDNENKDNTNETKKGGEVASEGNSAKE